MRRLLGGTVGRGAPAAAPSRVRSRLPSGAALVTVALSAALLAVCAASAASAAHLPGAGSAAPLPLWALVAVVALGELIVVTVDLGREGHPISAAGLALVLGLFFAAPSAIVPAELLGAAPVVAVRRRPLDRRLLELGGLGAGAGIAVTVFRLVAAGSTDPLQLRTWAAALLATLAAASIGLAASLIGARGAASGTVVDDSPLHAAALTAGAAVTTAALGLLAALGLRTHPADAGLVLIPAAALCLSARAYTTERRRNRGIRLLYDSTRAFHSTPEMELAILDLLSAARAMFAAQHAELTLLPTDESRQCFRTSIAAGERIALMAPVELSLFEEVAAVVIENRDGLLLVRGADATITDHLEQRGLRHAMLAPLRNERGVIGTMLVADRLSTSSEFDSDDLKLLATLASHATMSLERGRLEASVDHLTALQGRLEHQAFRDPLTGLANRSLFLDRLEHALGRRRTQVAVLFIDLDDFKRVNDSLGHTAGDELLRAVARRVHDCVRPADTAARLGGDEFAVLLEDITGLGDATSVAERVVASLSRPVKVGGSECAAHASVGVVLGRAGEVVADELLHNADVAMYVAKGQGKGRYQVFEPSMQAAVLERHELRADLSLALRQGAVPVHFQAIVDLRSGAIVAAEAVARWHHPSRGGVTAAQLLELADDAGLSGALGLHVLRTACRQAARWRDAHAGAEALEVAANVPPRQLLEPGFCDELAAILAETGLVPAGLILEITETALLDHVEAITRRLAELRSLGVRLALADFGTGHSSLTTLRELPVDILKIARPLVGGLVEGAGGPGLVRAVVDIARALELEVIAEGVDHPAQAEMLIDMGVSNGQGDLLHRAGDPLVFGAHLSGQARRLHQTTSVDGAGVPAEPAV